MASASPMKLQAVGWNPQQAAVATEWPDALIVTVILLVGAC